MRLAILFASLFFIVSCTSLLLMRPAADAWEPAGAPALARPSAAEITCSHFEPERQAFFGDLHVHTRHSMDARSRDMLGTPDDAYRFARGEAIGLGPFDASGRGTRRAQLERPLDFAAVTDHAEWIGEVGLCSTPGSPSYDTERCQSFRGEIPFKPILPGMKLGGRMTGVIGISGRAKEICGDDDAWCRASLLSAWQSTQAATERWNDTTTACAFTAFHGWEHSYSAGQSKIHRNVIFKNEQVPELPISSLETPDAVDLWDQLDAVCTNAIPGGGCEAVTIPHNANVSNGRLFEISWRRENREEQRRQARLRSRFEPVVEIMQIKGESECRNGLYGVLGGEDELCTFEKIRSFAGEFPEDCKEGTGIGAIAGRGCQSRTDFARYALIEGLREKEKIGVNPFQFGFVGSTDTHNATPGDVAEYSFQGCCATKDTTPEERLSQKPGFGGNGNIARNPGGLMGVWSEENSRSSLFDAIKRRETFATSGPRLAPRFFAGWDLPDDLCEGPNFVATGYAEGVPMGSVLESPAQSGRAPKFAASVARDVGVPGHPGGLLDRLQIIKVWHGEDGEFHQEVHDIAGRKAPTATANGAPAPASAPASVDLDTCEPQGSGHGELCAVWTDPHFDPTRAAAYYVRAVENPSCRWSWRECLALPADAPRPSACDDPGVPKTIQERAWTSPIWIEPAISES
ncbi:MAG: DUF3604 domain-containing protein [Myxococcota bacterium]